jgi:prophage antirepressor-like protein
MDLTTGRGKPFFVPHVKKFTKKMKKENSQAPTVNEQPSEVMTFQFSESKQPVRNLLIETKPWFVAKDVCDVLALSNHKVAIKALDEDEVRKTYLTDSLGRNQETSIISESGLYALILRSNKPYAKTFRKWITSEVIPQLLKKGYYGVKSQQSTGGYIDARNEPYQTKNFNGYNVRHISIDGQVWFSLNDLNRALHSSTGSNQLAKKLNVIETLAIKIWLFGNTHPAWFTNTRGAELTLSGSRVNNGLQLMIGGLTE